MGGQGGQRLFLSGWESAGVYSYKQMTALMSITYNSIPGQPAGRGVTPCASVCAAPVVTSSATPRLTGAATDDDGGQLSYLFQVWAGWSPSPSTLVASGTVGGVQSGVLAGWTVPSGLLTNGSAYEYRVQASDGVDAGAWSDGWVTFTVDTIAPPVPTVASAQFPANGWGSVAAGALTFSDTAGDVASWSGSTDGVVWGPQPTATLALSGLVAGWHTVTVSATDQAGNTSPVTTFAFGVGTGAVQLPVDQDRTQERVNLQGSAPTGRDWVGYQYRVGKTAEFTAVPTGDLTVPGTQTHPGLPARRDGGTGQFPVYVWDVGASAAHVDGLVQVEGCYGTSATDPSPLCSTPANVQLAAHAFGASYATVPAGPGTLSLLSGDLSVDATDVTVPDALGAMTIGRTATTLAPPAASTAATGVFGPGWTANLAGSDAGDADQTLTDHAADGYVTLTDSAGGTSLFMQTSAGSGYPITFIGVADASGDGTTLTKDSASQYSVHDSDGTTTLFTLVAGSWVAASVSQPGSATTTTFSYDGQGRVTLIVGPVPNGVTCTSPLTTVGCRTLSLTYATASTATAGTPGDYAGRLQKVTLTAADPAAGNAMTTVEVAHYSYDVSGYLLAAWDPRTTPTLATGYGYAGGRLSTLTPPGQTAWTFRYDGAGRLTAVTRHDPTLGQDATTTIVYDVAFTGSAAPIEMGAAATAGWGQSSDLPAAVTAVFPPDHVPAATPTSADWPYARLSYLDGEGREVDTASFGAGGWQIAVTQHDKYGNSVWRLSAQNRDEALTPTAGTDPFVARASDPASRANLLAVTAVYSADGSELLDSFGPTHPIRLADGGTTDGRQHTHTVYDEGAPGGGKDAAGNPFRLATTVTSSVQDPAGGEHDATSVINGYAAVVVGDTDGWTLRKPTTVTTVMGAPAANLVRTSRYDAQGRVVETRQPASAAGGGPGSTLTGYYTATGTGPCGGHPEMAGRACSSAPAAQPAGYTLPATTTSYTMLYQPATVTETSGATVRTTTTQYDAAGRRKAVSVTVTPAGALGVDVPQVSYGYDPATGLPTTTTTSDGSITVGYDTFGRTVSYTDADANTATTSFDIDGRPATSVDGKYTTSYSYDGTGEHRGLLTGLNANMGPRLSTFTGSYDGDGQLAVQTFPNGLVATTSRDNTGSPVGLSYDKAGSSWLQFTAARDGSGRIARQASAQSTQVFGYDNAGRLVQVADQVADSGAGSCTTRVYGFDTDSNRLSVTAYPDDHASPVPHCTTATTPVTVGHSYDGADRLSDPGYSYDTVGRTTSVPAADTTGSGPLTVGYTSIDMVASQQQNAVTRSWTLDPNRRLRTQTDSASGLSTTNHYTDTGDSPAWLASSDGSWTRNVVDLAGQLAAIQDNTNAVKLQLTDLRGNTTATVVDTTQAAGPYSYTEYTEYGTLRTIKGATPARYGYLGAHRRSSDTLAGLTLMGVRLYNPTTGRLLSTDPIPGGSDGPYLYPTDPINHTDLNGQCWRHWGRVCRAWNSTARARALAVRERAWMWRHTSGLGLRCLRYFVACEGNIEKAISPVVMLGLMAALVPAFGVCEVASVGLCTVAVPPLLAGVGAGGYATCRLGEIFWWGRGAASRYERLGGD